MLFVTSLNISNSSKVFYLERKVVWGVLKADM